jgi:hypothetical protein
MESEKAIKSEKIIEQVTGNCPLDFKNVYLNIYGRKKYICNVIKISWLFGNVKLFK